MSSELMVMTFRRQGRAETVLEAIRSMRKSPILCLGSVVVAIKDSAGEITVRPVQELAADGDVDTPPTVYHGLVLAGCSDGYLYCLRASDGALAWRFRAAPVDERLMSYEQIESVWPVTGSVLVHEGVVYCTAGRSSFLDGGILVYALDAKSGELLHSHRLEGPWPDITKDTGGTFAMEGALPDVLSCDGQFVYMRHTRFDLEGNRLEDDVPHLFSPAGFTDDAWWHRTYWVYGRYQASGHSGYTQAGAQGADPEDTIPVFIN